jgi:CRISPR-associated protein Cas2
MNKNYNYNYAFVFYDISDRESEAGKNRVTKVFKLCKKYFKHHQKSVFRGNITPSSLIKFKNDIKQIIDQEIDYISIIKLRSKAVFDEETIGSQEKDSESIFL